MNKQTVEEWLAAGNQIKVGKPQLFITYNRILTILNDDRIDRVPERACGFCLKPLDGRRRQKYCGRSCYAGRRAEALLGTKRGPYPKAPPRVAGPLYDRKQRSYRVRLRFEGEHRDFSERTLAEAQGVADSLRSELTYWASGS